MKGPYINMKKLLLLLLIVFAVGCAYNTKSYISKPMYDKAEEFYKETNSLEKVRESLEKLEWLDAEIDEAIYRLKKVHNIDE